MRQIARVAVQYVRQVVVVVQDAQAVEVHVRQTVIVAVVHVWGVNLVVGVQAAVMDVEQGAILDAQALAKHLALVNALAHVFKRVPDSLQLKF